MAVTIGSGGEIILELEFQDFRGQKAVKRIPLGIAVTDADVIGIITAVDALTNAKLIKVAVLTERLAIGMKSAAVNALERNISEAMELSYDAVNTNGKKLTRSILIPAMVAAQELIDGSPDITNSSLVTLTGLIQTDLTYLAASGALVVGGFTFNESESHHVTLADVVDAK